MNPWKSKILVATLGMTAMTAVCVSSHAQEPNGAESPTEREAAPQVDRVPERGTHAADGRQQRGVPIETYAVAPGTQFLVRLEDPVSTKEMHENEPFRVCTLEPLLAGSGIYLPAGAEIRGHVSRVEPAGVAGRAKIWLTFDEIRARFGWLPIVADVISVPGDHSIKAEEIKEGVIEGRTTKEKDALPAAAAGAALGAVKGVKDKNKKEAMEGAAMGALTAFLEESGRGHDINLPKGAKLELELGRALYLVKE